MNKIEIPISIDGVLKVISLIMTCSMGTLTALLGIFMVTHDILTYIIPTIMLFSVTYLMIVVAYETIWNKEFPIQNPFKLKDS